MTTEPDDEDFVAEVAADAYVYAYPLVLMELTRRAMTNAASPAAMKAPVNQFAHAAEFPDASFTDVVRPNADTLYSSLHFDVAAEPLVISVPDSGGRYYMLPMLDMWTDVFAVPGSRTTGNDAQVIVLSGPGWRGQVPTGTVHIEAPTPQGWIIGRTQTDGTTDYPAVHDFQRSITVLPLSQLGNPSYVPAPGPVDPTVAAAPPPEQVEALGTEAFFALFCALAKANPPHANDHPILARMARIGIVPGEVFTFAALPPGVPEAIETGAAAGLARIKEYMGKSGHLVNGWRIWTTAIGTYGADYLGRAGIAYGGLGANPIEDAVYPTALAEPDGRPFDSDGHYVLHFEKDEIPPVRGFWSLTMYDKRQLFADNPLNRYVIGDRDPLALGPDGSLDLYIQKETPGPDKETNWLPTPHHGPFTMNLRLYWPKSDVLDGSWAPPAVHASM